MGVDRDDIGGVTPTATLAQLYEEQGFPDKAAAVYRKLAALGPEADRTDGGRGPGDVEGILETRRAWPQEPEARTVLSELRTWQRAVRGRKQSLDGRQEKGRRILVILGTDPEIRGQSVTSLPCDVALEHLDRQIRRTAQECDVSVDTFQSDHEATLVQKIQDGSDGYDVLIINPTEGAHTSVAMRDALSMLDMPIIEVHRSNVCGQEPSRQKSLIAGVATAHLAGFGEEGYRMAVRAAARMAGITGAAKEECPRSSELLDLHTRVCR